MKRLGAVLHELVRCEAITVAAADRLWEAASADLREVEVVSQGTSASPSGSRSGDVSGVMTS